MSKNDPLLFFMHFAKFPFSPLFDPGSFYIAFLPV